MVQSIYSYQRRWGSDLAVSSIRVLLLFLFLFILSAGEVVAKENTEVTEETKVKVQEAYGKLPLYFIQNNGQVDEKVRFYEKGTGHSTFFTKEGVYISLSNSRQAISSSRNGTPGVAAADFSLRPMPESGKNAVPLFPSPHWG